MVALCALLLVSCKEKQSELESMAGENEMFSQNFNSEAVTKFWQVVDELKNDHQLNDSLWNDYHELPGNKQYMVRNRNEEQVAQHREFLELFFRPSLSDSLQSIMKSGEFQNNDIFQNLQYIKDNEEAIRNYTKILTSPEYLPEAIALTKKYLPKENKETIPENLTIYIQAITYDAAVQDSSMYFGLSIVHDFDRLQQGTVAAHELHHVLRKKKEIVNSITQRDSASVWVLQKINNEGTADLIDKVFVLDPENNTLMGPLFKQVLMSDIEPVMTALEEAFLKNAGNSEDFVDKKQFNEIIKYFSGHIPGFYMAEIIKRNGLEQNLIEGSENPFTIFYLYDQAAARDQEKPFRFSEEVMNYLRSLEKKAF